MQVRSLLTALVVALLLVGAAAGPALAAHDGSDESGQQAAQTTPHETTPTEPTQVVAEVDEDIRVLDYGLEGDDTFWLTLENTGDRSTKVTVTEAISGDRVGSGRFGIEQLRIGSGEQVRVEVSIDPSEDTKGVMITTPKSVNQGRGTFLQIDDSPTLFDFGASWNTVRVAYLAGVLCVLAAILGGAWWLVSARREDVDEADLDPDQSMWGALK